ncbi:MAG: hypothetical protein QOD39_5159 [Mycobacterium sp.]|nr:hypothetical protein [Mycobacterium sp.]
MTNEVEAGTDPEEVGGAGGVGPADPPAAPSDPDERKLPSPEVVERTGLAELTELIKSGRFQVLEQVFGRHLDGEITGSTVRTLQEDLTPLVSVPTFVFLSYISQQSPGDLRKELDGLEADEETLLHLRGLLALYKTRLSHAWAIVDDADAVRGDDWRSVDRAVLRDVRTGEFEVRHLFWKYNGETLTITGDADSTMRLARNLLESVNLIDDPAAFAPADVKRLRDVIDRTLALLDRADTGERPPAAS